MLLAIDSNIIIGAVAPQEHNSPQAQQLIRSLSQRQHRAVMSAIAYGEILSLSSKDSDFSLDDFLAHIPTLNILAANAEVCTLAGTLCQQYGANLKLPDAIHLATALAAKADVLITNDIKLSKIAARSIKTLTLPKVNKLTA